ncbi:serine/threonine-protein kinase [Trichothermofontia sichuanensis B231]|uniref:protein kinase domain-containing protein n=1 Tax=Trichothermofontia sichuanensis TaxID=3045816 RepID=UPI0022480EDF|nr:tetratricopeptide repeat protein [Trichothermofontia sichuanensis]UZQ53263.1 serine/threonine-protein kinase [Trichothermofontia sichuanensis B231]
MSYCLNPECPSPHNPDSANFCQGCGTRLRLANRYRALKQLGEGGFSRTFLAVDEYKPSQPTCVIKQFLPQVQGAKNWEKAAALFAHEAKQLEELGSHAQIPELYAYFSEGKQQYLVQEFIDGLNLQQELEQQGAFDEDQIRQVLGDLLPVLEYVHDRQVIHRDIKPENIIRRRQGVSSAQTGENNGQPPSPVGKLVLVDFGAAKSATHTALKQAGTRIYSLGYAAPEQEQGWAVFASDLYSLGVTCIHLLTHIEPFNLYDSTDRRWVWRDYLRTPISPQLAELIDRLLQPELSHRYPSAAAVLADLKKLPIGIPVGATATASTPAGTAPSLISRLLGGAPSLLRGNLLLKLGRLDGAIEAYDRAIQANPNNVDAWYRKAEALRTLNHPTEALGCYERVVQLQPNHYEAWSHRGILLLRVKQYEAALASFDRALQWVPYWSLIWFLRSVTLKQLGRHSDAKASFYKGRSLLPENGTQQATILLEAWELMLGD